MRASRMAGAVALCIAASSFAYAQSGNDSSARPQARFTAEDFQALTDAHIAALKAGLKLTADQEKNWPPVEAAIRDLAKARDARLEAARNAGKDGRRDALEALRRQADAMSERAAGLKKLADAAEPLYKSLDDGQKRRLRFLSWSARMRAGLRARAERR